jgi:hypothetical protein
MPVAAVTWDDLPKPMARRIVLTRFYLDRTGSPRGKHLRMVCRRAASHVAVVKEAACSANIALSRSEGGHYESLSMADVCGQGLRQS